MTLINELKHLLAETLLTDKETTVNEATRRFEICKTCEHYDPENMTCGVCGCFMDIKTTLETNHNPLKLRTEKTHCPLGNWGDKEIANFYRALDKLPLLQ